jgi:dipeptidase E
MTHNLLLVSNSTLHGSEYLDHCELQICEILKNRKTVAFVPYARPSGISHASYTDKARERFARMGYQLKGVHEGQTPRDVIQASDAIFIGGGNTFVLLKGLYENNLLEIIRSETTRGKPYIGTSAGANVACQTICTTNDMPIVYPPSFKALGLVPFNINPHYLDPDLASTHKGETRETRIREFLVFNDVYVVGLREGAMLHVHLNSVVLKGKSGARLFRKGQETLEFHPGDVLDFLMQK